MNDENFKEWAKAHKYNTNTESCFYTNTHTQSAWEAWKAAKQTKPLSDEEIEIMASAFIERATSTQRQECIEFARAIEERHGIK